MVFLCYFFTQFFSTQKQQKEISFFPLLAFLQQMSHTYLFCVLIPLDYKVQEFCFHQLMELKYYQYKRSFHLLVILPIVEIWAFELKPPHPHVTLIAER